MLPLFTAPMDTVVDLSNMNYFTEKRINVSLPRTIPIDDVFKQLQPEKLTGNLFNLEYIFPSIGLGEVEDLCHNRGGVLKFFKNILIDVANGHMKAVSRAAWHVKQFNPDIKVMVGNIANPKTYRWYAEGGNVDYIRVGIGNGGGCLTTKQSGVGYPMASLIQETYLVKRDMEEYGEFDLPAIVADGGMKDYADIVKALALGADYVMLGSIFNKALESCAPCYYNGKIVDKDKAVSLILENKEVTKHFRGMSTKGAQKAMGKTAVKTSEGVERFRPVEYTLKTWVENFEHYLRNAMSYADASTLDEFIGKAEFCQITTRAYDRFNK